MTDSIQRELELEAPPAAVWDSLTDSELLAEWLADEVKLELRPGGDAHFRIGDRIRTGWVEEVSPPHPGRDCARLTFWWGEDEEPASRVQLALAETERGTTMLRIVETRPLEILDLVGLPLPGLGGARRGPALVAA